MGVVEFLQHGARGFRRHRGPHHRGSQPSIHLVPRRSVVFAKRTQALPAGDRVDGVTGFVRQVRAQVERVVGQDGAPNRLQEHERWAFRPTVEVQPSPLD